jgi:hypothetical protein
MTDTNNKQLSALLLDARKMYMARLAEIMTPVVVQTIKTLYHSAKCKLIDFQMQLKQVPLWNSMLVSSYTKAIEAEAPYLADLIAAGFVSAVKILSSIKLGHDKPNIRIKLPTNDSFVHQVFIQVARTLYDRPTSIRETDYNGMQKLVHDAIEVCIRRLLPLSDILKCYLGTSVDPQDNCLNPAKSPVLSDDGTGSVVSVGPSYSPVSSSSSSSDGAGSKRDAAAAPPAPPANVYRPAHIDDILDAEKEQELEEEPVPQHKKVIVTSDHVMHPPPPANPSGAVPLLPKQQVLFPDARDDDRHFG